MNDTRLYILTAFRAHATTGKDKLRQNRAAGNNTHLRLYCIHVAASLDRKFTLLWTYTVEVKGHVPYVHTRRTYCDIAPGGGQGAKRRDNGLAESVSEWTEPLSVLTMTADRLLATARVVGVAGNNVSYNMSVMDLGTTYSVISSGYSENLITSISWSNSEREYHQRSLTPTTPSMERINLPRSTGEAGGTFWVTSSPYQGNTTALEKLTELAGPPVNGSCLSLTTTLTTPVTLLQYPVVRDTSCGAVDLLVFGSAGDTSCDEAQRTCCRGDELCDSTRTQPQLVGVLGEGGGGRGEGRREGGGEDGGRGRKRDVPSIVWSVPLPHSQPVRGQISTLSLSSETYVFLTTPLGVYAYTIT